MNIIFSTPIPFSRSPTTFPSKLHVLLLFKTLWIRLVLRGYRTIYCSVRSIWGPHPRRRLTLPPPAASVRRGISWAPPSPMLGFGLALSWLHISCMPCQPLRVVCARALSCPCRCPLPLALAFAPSPRVISEPSGMGSDVAIHLELYRAENPTASGWPVIGLRINLYLRTKKLPW